MKKNLQDYVKIFTEVLEDSQCDKILKEVDADNSWQPHQYHNPLTGEYGSESGERELDVSWAQIQSKKFLHEKIWHVIKLYIDEVDCPWYKYWNGFTNVRFNRYRENCIMKEHCDHIHNIFDGEKKGIPILTVLGALDDEYEGGEFVIFGSDLIKIPKGGVIVFPSIFLYPHKVNPVTKGVRHTYVSWVW